MIDAPDLLPCPFCGNPAQTNLPPMRSTVYCTGCATKCDDASTWNTRARPMTVSEAAKVLLASTPKPIFDNLKYPMMGEFSQTQVFVNEDGDEDSMEVTIEWTAIKEIIEAALRALSQGGE